ncbi:MAG: nucleotidyltransferase family protein [Terracidiphilus sp.]
MKIGPIQIETQQRARLARLKEAVFASFHEPAPSIRARLAEFTPRDWERAKYWLDVSGLALYFLDQLITRNLELYLPVSILHQLRTNMAENRERSASLFSETVSVTQAMQQQEIEFAVLKGITLPPESVPDGALRNQMDLDVLVRESNATRAKNCLADLGYALDAISGTTWEFKAGPSGSSTVRNLYQVRPERSIEVHLIGNPIGNADRLTRSQHMIVRGEHIRALSPADAFVLQGQHLFKHMCGEFTRASWVLEYWRHVCARRDDILFWREVESIAANEPGADIAIGGATLLTSFVFGPFAPQDLVRWSLDRLPPAICLWIQLYGRDILLSDTPGSKLYLLLRKELNPASVEEQVARRRLMFPLHLPQRITRPEEDESIAQRLRRYHVQVRFVIRRLWFHLAKGVAFAVELPRWRGRVAGVSQ